MESHTENLLTVEQLAEWLQAPTSWVYRHTAPTCRPEQRLPSVRLDRGLRFRRRDIEAWLDAHSGRARDAPEDPNVHKNADSRAIAAPRSDSRVQVGVGARGPDGTENTSGSETEGQT